MNYKYDVAISYNSEIEKKAQEIFDFLKAEKMNVFFAPAEQKELVSESLNGVLYDIYKNQSLVRVLLISEKYLVSEWTLLEKRVSMFDNDNRRVITVNYLENGSLPMELRKYIYLDGKTKYTDEIAAITANRVYQLKSSMNTEIQPKMEEKSNISIQVQNNKGIIAGDHAVFGDISIGR